MKIAAVSFDGCRCLPDTKVALASPTGIPHNLIAVTGPRASGKTTFLETVIAAKEVAGPYGVARNTKNYLRLGLPAAKVVIDWHLSPQERGRLLTEKSGFRTESIFGAKAPFDALVDPLAREILGNYSSDADIGKVEYFHASRQLLPPTSASLTGSACRPHATDRLTRSNDKYEGLVDFMVELGLGLDQNPDGTPKEEGRISRAFEALCPTKKLAGLFRLPTGIAPIFANEHDEPFMVGQLSESEQDALLFAASFVRSGIAGSVVLIDTPEKYVGDQEAWAFLKALSTLASDNQLLVATRARSILTELAPDQIVRLGAS